jgi:hypothetical protein
VDQFEFLTNDWVNSGTSPEGGGGFDIIIGQNGASSQRERTAELLAAGSNPSQTLTFEPEWVIPTGGGYFFAPSIEALATVLSA